MLPLHNLRPVQNQPTNPCRSYLKQYWPALIYKTALTGLAVGEYGLHRWQFTAGVAGVGLITMYVLSYFLRKDEFIANPGDVQEYQDISDQNIEALGVAADVMDQIEDLTTRQTRLLEEGRASILQNEAIIRSEALDLSRIRIDTEASEGILNAAMDQIGFIETKVIDLAKSEEKDVRDLESSIQSLNEITAKGLQFLEDRKLRK